MEIGSLVGYIDLDTEKFKSSVEGLKGFVSNIPAFVGFAAAGVAAGALFASALSSAMDVHQGQAKLAGQLGLTSEESARYGKLAGQLYSQNYGESLTGVNDAIAAVVTSIGGMRDASDADMQAAAKNALNFASAMDVDVATAAQTVGLMVKNGIGKDSTEAFDLLTATAQKVGPAMVEPLMDAVNEYGTNFAAIGLSGEQAMGVLAAGAANGEIALDKVGDAVKELTIRGTDMSTSSVAAYQAIGLNAKDMSNALLAGGDTAAAATQKIVDGLQGIQDPATKANTAIALFGTPLEDIGTDKIPAFLSALEGMDGALGDVAGSAAALDATLGSTAAGNIEAFRRSVETAFVTFVGGQALPAVTSLATTLGSVFGPAVMAAGSVLSQGVVPALRQASQFMSEHSTAATVVGGVIGAVLLPALAALTVQAVTAAGAQVVGWATSGAAAVTGAATQLAALTSTGIGYVTAAARAIASFATMAAGWVAAGVTAVVNAAVVVGGWILIGLQAGLSALQTLAGFAVMAAGWVAAGVVAVANAAVVVGGWVLMGTQSLIQAARMAAAWFIALGPVGWVIAAVIALAALVIANWDTIRDTTVKVWDRIVLGLKDAWVAIKEVARMALDYLVGLFLNFTGPGLIIKHWDSIRDAAQDAWAKVKQFGKDALDGLVTLFMNFTGPGLIIKHWDTIVSTARELPGRILDALSTIGSTVMQIGTDIIDGIKRGITGGASSLASAVKDAAGKALTAAKDFLGIKSPSRVFRDQVGAMVPAGMAEGILGGVDLVTAAVEQLAALPGNVSIPASVGVGSFAAGDGSLYGTVLAGSSSPMVAVLSQQDRDLLLQVADRPAQVNLNDEVLASSVGGVYRTATRTGEPLPWDDSRSLR